MTGEAELQRKLKQLQGAVKEIVKENTATVENIVADATILAGAAIRGKIQQYAQNGGLVVGVTVNAGALGAYIEFGTGQSAAQLVPTLPEEWQQTARRYYVNGQGRLKAQPYIYPAFFKNTAGYEERIKAIMQKAIR